MMKEHILHDQAIALSALTLSIQGIEGLAQKGHWNQDHFKTLMSSLTIRDASRIEDYYPDILNLESGRRDLVLLLKAELEKKKIYYAMQLIATEKKLSRNAELSQKLLTGLNDIDRKLNHFDLFHESIFAKLADIYQETASKAGKKIQIYGQPQYLQQVYIQNQVRTLLLCGIRAAALWRANGGNKWQLLLKRKPLTETVKTLKLNVLEP